MSWCRRAEEPSVSDTDSDMDTGLSKLTAEEDSVLTPREPTKSELADQLVADLAQQIAKMEADKLEAEDQLTQLDALWTRRRQPFVDKVECSRVELVVLKHKLTMAQHSRNEMPPAPGPPVFEFVDDTWFAALGNLMVLLNLIYMVFAHDLKEAHLSTLAALIDNTFMVWYVFELGAKTMYHQRNLFIGRPSVVWWNWLDLLIVVSGIIDQWMLPLLCPGSSLGPFSFLRALRIFRVLRVLKLVKAFVLGDMSWSEQPPFEVFMSGVIAINSITMWLELDYDWPIWPFVENAFLIIYTFELSVRIKHNGCRFFTNPSTIVWNTLDFIMVVGGILDLWLMPLITYVESLVSDGKKHHQSSGMSNVLSLLKLMRILRVLRLVRLLRAIKPLYRLLIGVMEALRAMQWVMILTLLVLYAGAIMWTTLIGKGMMMPVTEESSLYFGSVPVSLFSLFKLMNGDDSVVEPITGSALGQLMFAGFMVLSNWAVLAILTSVVSDNMISSSTKAAEEEQERVKTHEAQVRADRLRDVFMQFDKDRSGAISESEWRALMDDRVLGDEVLDTTGYTKLVLDDIVACLTSPSELKTGRLAGTQELIMNVEDFITRLDDSATPVDNRAIMHVTSELRGLQGKMQKVTDDLDGLKDLKQMLKQ